MAKKKEKKKTAEEVELVGGPRDGDRIRLVYPPPARIRLAFPEWCNYYLKDDGRMHYDMSIPWETLRDDF